MRGFATWGLVIAVTVALGCSGDDTEPAATKPPVVALYGVAAETQLTPYPSDRYTIADPSTPTGLRVHLGPDTTAEVMVASYVTTVDELNAMDGFSTTGGVVVSFSAPIDPRGIVRDDAADPPLLEPARDAAEYAQPGSPIVLVDVDPASPARGQAVGLVPRWWSQAADGYYLTDEHTLIAQPARPLRPATRYLFAVTKRLLGADGQPVARSAEAARLLDGAPADAYAEEVQAGLAEAEASLGLARDDVVLASAFTTATIHDDLVAMAKAARAAPAPALASEWAIETPLQADGRVRFRASYEAPEYRKPAPDGKWEIGEDGRPIAQQTIPLELFLAFSDATRSGPRPVVIFGHGLGGDKDGCWGTSERLAELDVAVFGIDSPEHGSRAADPEQNPIAASFSFFGIDSETQTFDIGRARDNFRQMASDQLELVRFIGSLGDLDLLPVGAPDGVPDLDVSRILYIGHSFGSVQGPTIFALAPEITQACWNVGGDGLMTLLRDSGTFSLLVKSMTPPGTPEGSVARFFAVTQAIVDPGDPLNFARYGTEEALDGVPGWTARDVLLQEVLDDSIVPNSTSEALARALGLELADAIRPVSGLAGVSAPVTGNLASGATGVLAQFDRVNGDELATHGELIFTDEARAQYVSFFASGLASGRATVPPAYPR
jgi:hypothetical protein